MNKLNFLIVFLFVGMFSSCSKEDVSLSEQNQPPYQVIDGRVVFSSNAAVVNLLNNLGEKTDEELDKWEEENGFYSYRRSLTICSFKTF